MPVLSNPKHERFAQELAKGESADEAANWRAASPTGATRPSTVLASVIPVSPHSAATRDFRSWHEPDMERWLT